MLAHLSSFQYSTLCCTSFDNPSAVKLCYVVSLAYGQDALQTRVQSVSPLPLGRLPPLHYLTGSSVLNSSTCGSGLLQNGRLASKASPDTTCHAASQTG